MSHRLWETMEPRRLMAMTYGVSITPSSGSNSNDIVNPTKAAAALTDLNAKAIRYWISTNFTSSSSDNISSGELADLKAYHDAGIETTICVTLPQGITSFPSGMNVGAWIENQIQLHKNDSKTLTEIVDNWEIISEPDYTPAKANPSSGSYWPGTLTQYVNNALKPAYQALHSNGLDETVIGAALTDGGSTSTNFNELKTAGYVTYSDKLNMHPYGTSPSAHKTHVQTFVNVFKDPVTNQLPKGLVSTEWNVKAPSGTLTDNRNVEDGWETTWKNNLIDVQAYDKNIFEKVYYYRFAYDTTTRTRHGGLVYTDTTNYNGHQPFYNLIKGWANNTQPPPPPPTFPITADGYVYSGATTTNYGSANLLAVKKSTSGTNDRQAYLKFDIADLPANATNVKLHVYGNLSQADTVGVNVQGVPSTSWTESGLTWSNKPAVDSVVQDTLAISSTTNAAYEFDVTDWVMAAKGNGDSAVALGVLPTATATSAYFQFASKEDATVANRPYLTYTVTSPTVAPTADAYVFSGATSTNYGTDGSLSVKKSASGTTDRRAFLKFDISNLNANATNIVLRLTGKVNVTEDVDVGVYGVSSTGWSESTLTWANKPSVGNLLDELTVGSTSDATFDFDVTTYVRDAIDANQSTITLALVPTGASTTAIASFYSREGSSTTGPKLVVA